MRRVALGMTIELRHLCSLNEKKLSRRLYCRLARIKLLDEAFFGELIQRGGVENGPRVRRGELRGQGGQATFLVAIISGAVIEPVMPRIPRGLFPRARRGPDADAV